MRPDLPWNVAGIPSEARDAARAAARREGLSVGEWLTRRIVKDFAGDPQYQDKKEFDSTRPVTGRKIKVVFKDGELLIGTTQGYQPGRPGFFVIPIDPNANSDRCFVVSAATNQVSLV